MSDASSFYRDARDAAVDAAQQAARLIRRHAGRLGQDGVQEKGTHDLVTEIDGQAQRMIIDALSERFPDHAVLAEEGAQSQGARGPYDGHRWIIDPIDGTTNFTHGLAPYSVSIGLQAGEDMVVGVVLDVDRNELFTAVKGQGAYLNGTRMQVSTADRLAQCIVATGFPFKSFDHVDAYLAVLKACIRKTQSIRRLGSAAVDLATIASGRCDAYFQTSLSPWDVAAGLLLVREAGGQVTDFSGQAHTGFEHQVLATNGRVHAAMMEVVAPLQAT